MAKFPANRALKLIFEQMAHAWPLFNTGHWFKSILAGRKMLRCKAANLKAC
jgi:hypothetical protein